MTSRAGDIGASVQVICLKALRIEAPQQLLIARIADAGVTPPNPQPCHARYGYRVTNAHHDEVGVSADMPTSAFSLRAAAASPAAGATAPTTCAMDYNL
jgi:hypothetical protein